MIRFGTSGWRAVFSDEFTFPNVRKVAHAIAGHIKEHQEFGAASAEYKASFGDGKMPLVPLVVIGYDTRFLSEEFAHDIASVLASDGIKTVISKADLPTPALGWALLKRKAVGGIMITASHNPAAYNGLKWMPYWGGAAVPDITDDIERRVALMGSSAIKSMPPDRSLRESWIETVDFREEYFKQMLSLLDAKAIKKSRLKVGLDAMHGSGRHYLRPLVEKLGLEAVSLHEDRDVLFGGMAPEPTTASLKQLSGLMAKHKLDLGLALDGDADRFGVLDAGGAWISANEVLGLVFEHLVKNKGLRGKAARSVMTSHFLDAVAKSHGLETRETPVGFKFIGELLRGGAYLLGGEESGGLAIRGHVPEKDGILACLLLLELAAVEGQPLAKVRDSIFKKIGSFHNTRWNHHMDGPVQVIQLEERLKLRPPLDLAGSSVWRIDETDGFKFILRDGSWLGLRSSGTEPVFRMYAEAPTIPKRDALIEAGLKLLKGKF